MKVKGDVRTLFSCELFHLRLGARLAVNDMSGAQESLSDRETDSASYT